MTGRPRTPSSDAVTDSDALSHISTMRARAGARIPQYRNLRHCPSLRHSLSLDLVNEMTVPDLLSLLAAEVRRLSPSHRDPDAFHEAKSEIEAALHQLARVLPAIHVYGRSRGKGPLDEGGLSPKVFDLRRG